MFNFGFSELLLLGAIALLVIGPKQLPEVARALARTLNELKRATGDIGKVLNETKESISKPMQDITDGVNQKIEQAVNDVTDSDKPKSAKIEEEIDNTKEVDSIGGNGTTNG